MKNPIFFFFLYLLGVSISFSQNTTEAKPAFSDSEKFPAQISSFYDQGKYDEAIALAEKAVKLEREAPQVKLKNLATGILVLAILEKEHRDILRKELVKVPEPPGVRRKMNKYWDDIEPIPTSKMLFSNIRPIFDRSKKNTERHLPFCCRPCARQRSSSPLSDTMIRREIY